jgi:hypothetical protein
MRARVREWSGWKLWLGDQERGVVGAGCCGGLLVREECGEVVVEGEDTGVGGVVDAAGAGVGGAEIAGGVVGEAGSADGLGGFALPGTLGALRRDENPLAEQRIVAAVRD